MPKNGSLFEPTLHELAPVAIAASNNSKPISFRLRIKDTRFKRVGKISKTPRETRKNYHAGEGFIKMVYTLVVMQFDITGYAKGVC